MKTIEQRVRDSLRQVAPEDSHDWILSRMKPVDLLKTISSHIDPVVQEITDEQRRLDKRLRKIELKAWKMVR